MAKRPMPKTDDDTLPSALGGVTKGFSEDWEFKEYERRGVGFKSLDEVLDVEEGDASGSTSPNESVTGADEGRTREFSRPGGISAEITIIEEFDENASLEQLSEESGVSEWSRKLQNPESILEKKPRQKP